MTVSSETEIYPIAGGFRKGPPAFVLFLFDFAVLFSSFHSFILSLSEAFQGGQCSEV